MEVLKKLGIGSENPGAWSSDGWQSSSQGALIKVHNPSNGELIASVRGANREDYEAIMERALKGFKQWRAVPAPQRGDCIRLIAQELRLKKDLLGTLIALECGKIKSEADGEVQEMIDMADLAVGQSRMLFGKTLQSERKKHAMLEQWHPLGPVGVITAFNFPVAVWSWNAFLAAICGDTVVWKPSHKVPLSAIAVQRIVDKVMKEHNYEGVFSLFIPDQTALVEQMVADERLPLISFTGSTHVGKKVAVTVSKRLGRHLLELSGNNAVIVDETADLSLAIPSIVFGAVGTAGQRCTSTRRVIVHQSRFEALTAELIAAYQQVKVGDPLNSSTLMGPLIDEKAVQDFVSAIDEIKRQKGQILFGGKAIKGSGYFVEPTLVKVSKDCTLLQEETFAPILYLVPYETLSEAIDIQNNVRQGLSSALFTESLKHAQIFLSALGSDCGIANINIGTSGAEISGAFGGEKETGGGREAGSDVWQHYMRRQTNTINWGDELPLAQGIEFNLSKFSGSSS